MLRFNIILLIRHPSIDPQVITNRLGLEPFRCWRQGEPRFTPKGNKLPGTYPNTSWHCSFDFEGERSFFHSMQVLLERLDVHRDFFNSMVSEGGQIYLNVNLSGDENIGSVLNWNVMEKLIALKINIGVEVFPK